MLRRPTRPHAVKQNASTSPDRQWPDAVARNRSAHLTARSPARASGPHRCEEGLRSWPVRRLHGASGRPAGRVLPDAGSADGRTCGDDHRRLCPARTVSFIRCSRRSSITTHCSVAIARRVRSWRPWHASRKGMPARLNEIREYMSGNICRCGAYVGIVGAIQDAAAKMRRT